MNNEIFYLIIGMCISTFGELAFIAGQFLRERLIYYRSVNEKRKENK